jgi:hypothetical protein
MLPVERKVCDGVVHPMGSQGCLTLLVFPCHSGIRGNIRGREELYR